MSNEINEWKTNRSLDRVVAQLVERSVRHQRFTVQIGSSAS